VVTKQKSISSVATQIPLDFPEITQTYPSYMI